MTLIDGYYEERRRRRAWQSYSPKLDQGAGVIRQRVAVLTPSETPLDYLSDALLRKLTKALSPLPSRTFAPHFQKLDALSTDRTLLIGCNEPPSSLALALARAVLRQLETENLEPTRVVCSAEGGVALCFVSGDKYSDIECLNAGEILGVISNRRDRPTVWEIEPSASGFARAAARIRDFFGGAAISHDAKQETR